MIAVAFGRQPCDGLASDVDKRRGHLGKFVRSFAAILGALLLAGCVTSADFDDGTKIRAISAPADELATPKTVYFATTRCNDKPGAGLPGSAEKLYSERCWDWVKSDEVARLGFGMGEGAGVTCGAATVSVAPLKGDRKAATTVDAPASYDCSDNFETLRQVVLNSPCRCALIFVHGFNTTFGFGIKRAAQLSYDLGRPGVPIMFSFGAAGTLFDYVNDIESAETAAPVLQRFLATLTRKEGAVTPTIDVIAHSMGSRLTLRALSEGAPPSVRYAVLAAPDVDPAAFLRLAAKAAKHTERLTVYTAEYDVALSASKGSHGRARAGAGLEYGVAGSLNGAEIIDATARASDPYAHSYFAESPVVLEDIRSALSGFAAKDRKLKDCQGAPPGVVACKIPCPPGESCRPSLYARFVNWLF